jgi:flagellar basal body-associated protein FliL
MKKILITILLVVLAIGVVAWYFTTFRLDGVIKQQIEQVGSQSFGTAVTVGSVETDLKNGSLVISRIVIPNPPGYQNPNAATLNGIEAALDYSSFEIKRVIIERPEIVIEELNGETNFSELLAGLESSPEPAPPAEGAKQPTLVIHHFRMNESRAAFESASLEHYSELKIDAVEVKNVRGTPDEVAQVIAEKVLEEVVSEAAKELLKAKASEKIDDLFNRD